MDGFEVKRVEDTLGWADVYVTTTGNGDIIRVEHMLKMKDQAIVCNIGHFDNEIQVEALGKIDGVRKENVKPQVDQYFLPDSRSIFILAEGRLVNLGCAMGHPSFVMSKKLYPAIFLLLGAAKFLYAHKVTGFSKYTVGNNCPTKNSCLQSDSVL